MKPVIHQFPRCAAPVFKASRALALAMVVMLVSGCFAEEQNWNGKDISGLMPDLEFELTNTEGETVNADEFAGQVRLVFFGFTSCPDVCPTALAQLQGAVRKMPEHLQEQVTILFVSVDPKRDTPEKLASYVNFFGGNIVGLTADEPTLRKLAKRYRTTFGYGEPDAAGNYDVSHSSAIYVFDHRGQVRLLLRPELPTDRIRDDLVALAQQGAST